MKFSAWTTVYVSSITTEEMAKLPNKFANPSDPTQDELEKYFGDYLYEMASNNGAENLANGYLEIEPDEDDVLGTPLTIKSKDPDHEANYEELNTKAVDPKTGFWKQGGKAQEGRCKVNERVELYFNNIMLVLKPDGTYYLEDMSGG